VLVMSGSAGLTRRRMLLTDQLGLPANSSARIVRNQVAPASRWAPAVVTMPVGDPAIAKKLCYKGCVPPASGFNQFAMFQSQAPAVR
jgi:hypothetical protein